MHTPSVNGDALLVGGLGAAALLSGVASPWHSGAFSASRRAVADRMRDPASVQFRRLAKHGAARNAETIFVCGEFNARNGLGGYAGFHRFIVTWEKSGSDGRATSVMIDDGSRNPPINQVWGALCTMPVLEQTE